MRTVYLVMTVLVALMAAFSALGKIRRNPRQGEGDPSDGRCPVRVLSFAGRL